jgi:hypothetical protein
MAAAAVEWYNAHIYYYDDNKTDLILNGVQPLLRAIQSEVERAFFVRHWLRGPHLRLRVAATAHTWRTLVQPAIETYIGDCLRAQPSTTILDEATLLPIHARLQLDEYEDGPLTPFYPNNSIQYLPYDRRLHVIGDAMIAAEIEAFYAETNELVFAMLEYIRSGRSRLEIAFDLMITLPSAITGALPSGAVSYRSHAEAFIVKTPNPDGVRRFFDTQYRVRSAALAGRVRQIIEECSQNAWTMPFLAAWSALVSRLWQEKLAQIKDGRLNLAHDRRAAVISDERAAQLKGQQLTSPFHKLMWDDRESSAMLYQRPSFQCYRLLLNLQYLLLNRLGIVPFERSMLCHLAANAVEDVFDVSMTAMLDVKLQQLRASVS